MVPWGEWAPVVGWAVFVVVFVRGAYKVLTWVGTAIRTKNAIAGEIRDRKSQSKARGAMDSYRERLPELLERTPWALKPPVPGVGGRVSELVVQVAVGSADDAPEEERSSLVDLHEQHPTGHWMLLGDPGAGKTMALKEYGLWCLEEGLTPIYLRAQDLKPTLLRTLQADPRTARVAESLVGLVERGEAVLLVDSLDEADKKNQKARARELLGELVANEAARCRVFCASRTVGFDAITGFKELRLQPLSGRASGPCWSGGGSPSRASKGSWSCATRAGGYTP